MLLKTKLHLPQRMPNAVERSRIVNQFSIEQFVTILAAPTGYGKTSCVLEWLATLSQPVGWVSLDAGDNDVNQFLQYLFAACENVALELVTVRNQITAVTSDLSIKHILTVLINIFVDLAFPFVCVLDDYHLIQNPAIHQAMTFLIENKPANLHIVIMSRSELPFPIGRWRVKNEMTELRTADLRLTSDEIATFLATQNVASLSEEDVQALTKRTEGWIAAVQLAAIAMKGKDNFSSFIADFTGSHIYIVDYLTDEVMQQQSQPVQRFLMQTSILPRLSANLCDEILEIEDSQHILRELEAQNQFLISLDDQREWFRYHHLFQDMLRYRLQREAPEQIVALHSLASRWFIKHRWIEEGVSQAILANEWQTVTQIINQNVTAMFSQGKMSIVRRWFSQMPKDIILGNAELCINYAMALNLSGNSDEMNPYLGQAEQLLGQASQSEALEGQISILRGYQSRRSNEFSQSIHYLEKALSLLPPDIHVLRATAHIHLGIAHQLQADLERSLRHFVQAQQLARLHYTYSFTAASGLRAGVYVAMGQLQKAEGLCRSIMDEQEPNPGFGYVKMVLGAILLETNRLDEAETMLQQTVELGYLSADYTVTIHSLITLAQSYQQQMHLTDASTCLTQAQRLMQETQAHFGTAHYDQTQIRQWVLEKNIPEIQQWLAKYSVDDLLIAYQLIYAEGLIATEQFRQAIRIVENLKLPKEHIKFRIWAQNLLAVAYKKVRDDERCQEAIALALQMAEPASFQRIFCFFNRTMLQVVKATLASYSETNRYSVEYIGKLIKMLQDSLQPKQALEDPLTDREITVLRLMAAGLTNRAIAEELVISIGTVKGYSHNIYSKLTVSNRQDAVQSAFDLNLI